MRNEAVISSVHNAFVKIARSLQDKKGRMLHSAFLVEGEKCVAEMIKYMPEILRFIIITKGHEDKFSEFCGSRLVVVEPHVMKSICECTTPQYVAAIADIPAQSDMLIGFIVALDEVQDPANAGAIIRTADAAGCGGVILSEGCADPYAPKAVRATMGSLFHLPVIRTELKHYLKKLTKTGYQIVCADLKGNTDFKLDAEKTCLVIGNESRGISEEILALAGMRVRIPIYGKAESLNAAVAAGIMIYNIRHSSVTH